MRLEIPFEAEETNRESGRGAHRDDVEIDLVIQNRGDAKALLPGVPSDIAEVGRLLGVELVAKPVLGARLGDGAEPWDGAHDAVDLLPVPPIANLPLPGAVWQHVRAVVELRTAGRDQHVGNPHVELLHQREGLVERPAGGDAEADLRVRVVDSFEELDHRFVVARQRVVHVGDQQAIHAGELRPRSMHQNRPRALDCLARFLNVAVGVAVPRVVRVHRFETAVRPLGPALLIAQRV